MFHTDQVNINIKSKLKENLVINYTLIDERCKLLNAWEGIHSLHAGKFSCFFVVCRFFSKSAFSKNCFRNRIWVCQIVWTQIRPDILSGLICGQTVCKGYQQTSIKGKKLKLESATKQNLQTTLHQVIQVYIVPFEMGFHFSNVHVKSRILLNRKEMV